MKIKAAAWLIGAALVLGACGNNEAESGGQSPASAAQATNAAPSTETAQYPRKVEGAYGEIEIKKEPKVIVTTNYEDNLLALGVKPAAVHNVPDDEDGYFDYLGDQLQGVERVGDFMAFNFEKIIAMQPDLIIGTSYDYDEQKYKDLSKVAPVLLLDFTQLSWQDVHRKIAQALGKEAQAEQFIADYEKRESEVKDQLKEALAGKNVMYMDKQEKDFWVWGVKSTNDVGPFLYENLGITPTPGIGDDNGAMTLEGVSQLNPDVLFISESYYGEDFKNSEVWKNLKAVKNNQVYTLDKDFRIKMYYPIGMKEDLEELVNLFVK